MQAIDDYIPDPTRALDRPFSLPVEDVFSIQGRGTVVTGRIEQGVVKVGEDIEIIGIQPPTKTTVTGLPYSMNNYDPLCGTTRICMACLTVVRSHNLAVACLYAYARKQQLLLAGLMSSAMFCDSQTALDCASLSIQCCQQCYDLCISLVSFLLA